ncbi:hypothetical protein FAEPRAM212_03479 [Faecalibacterium prausnitzii M21/2]|uniref:Uncharacterized protein n=1 Tax=Faecalibacterium prausnitzii M21/2 TaxID=411485 RepID=A8SHV3_9FIRM|nr:hypothetical protein FAEPRAM212_03479 [Faecalibacterium prausnitzii M21/2]
MTVNKIFDVFFSVIPPKGFARSVRLPDYNYTAFGASFLAKNCE